MPTVCLGTSNTLRYPQGGHLWVFLNWADGFRSNGCDIIWLDIVDPRDSADTMREKLATLRKRIAPLGFADRIALIQPDGSPVLNVDCLSLNDAHAADLLFDLRYDLPEAVVKPFRKSALLDIDPGILQIAMQNKHMNPAPHDLYFTIGETVGQKDSRFPSLGLDWIHVPPAVSLNLWPVQPPGMHGAFTTVSHWHMNEWMIDEAGVVYKNDKREAFQPFLDLPSRVQSKLELAIHLNNDPPEQALLESHGWRIKESDAVAATPQTFQKYVQHSRGEFSCAKPAYVKMQTGWISDRTICYLASGRPVILQNTGPSKYLKNDGGVLRFNSLDEAVECFVEVEKNYESHGVAARGLVEKYFDAKKICEEVLGR